MDSLLPLYSIASKSELIASTFDVQIGTDLSPVFQARPNMQLPVIMDGNPAIQLGGWGIGQQNKMDISKTLQARPWNIWLRNQRCIIPANCFYGHSQGITSLVRLLDHRLFGIAGLCDINQGRVCFSILTTQSPPILKKQMDEIPILCSPEVSQQWLKANSRVEDLMAIADNAGSYWFDFYPISTEIINYKGQDKELLNPLGSSYQQSLEAMNKLKADPFKGERGRRHK